MKYKSIMVVGTSSSAGKTLLVTALCRLFKRRGFSVAPFKSQNMSRNSFITKDGLEISKAQAIQAEAAGVEPTVLMNPILLKPTSDRQSQIIVNGQPDLTMNAAEYYLYKDKLRAQVTQSFKQLEKNYDLVVIEGAGSPAEINLMDGDFVNMGMAAIAEALVVLVGDIERGGVFASLYGTVKLLPPADQKRIKGLIINKFRGDIKILEPGLKMIEQRLEIPMLGVLPYKVFNIEDEDSLGDYKKGHDPQQPGHSDLRQLEYDRLADFVDEQIGFDKFISLLGN